MALSTRLYPDLYKLKDGSIAVHVRPKATVRDIVGDRDDIPVETSMSFLTRPPRTATCMPTKKWSLSVDDEESPLVAGARAYSDIFKLLESARKDSSVIRASGIDSSVQRRALAAARTLRNVRAHSDEIALKMTTTFDTWRTRTKKYEDDNLMRTEAVVTILQASVPEVWLGALAIETEIIKRATDWRLREVEAEIEWFNVAQNFTRASGSNGDAIGQRVTQIAHNHKQRIDIRNLCHRQYDEFAQAQPQLLADMQQLDFQSC